MTVYRFIYPVPCAQTFRQLPAFLCYKRIFREHPHASLCSMSVSLGQKSRRNICWITGYGVWVFLILQDIQTALQRGCSNYIPISYKIILSTHFYSSVTSIYKSAHGKSVEIDEFSQSEHTELRKQNTPRITTSSYISCYRIEILK